MPHRNRTYEDLAIRVGSELRKRGETRPSVESLSALFEAMYYASLKTEESQSISFHIVFLDPDNPDPDPPKRIRNNRWMFARFDRPIPVTIQNLIKMAKASDPRTSSYAVHSDRTGQLFVSGLVDQGNSYNDYVNYESDSGFPRPGIFQASIAGTGHLIASIGLEKIAELKINKLVTNVLDVISSGPINDALTPGIKAYLKSVKGLSPTAAYQSRDEWPEIVKSFWTESLCRLLLRVQKHRHGGAVLISPGRSSKGLNVKYKLPYTRLRLALEKRATLEIEETYASDQLWEDYIELDADDIPVGLYLDELIARDDLNDNRQEIDGTIWFISLLTRVDGLVLLDPRLQVRGFGVEITYSEEPPRIFIASDRNATKAKLRRADYNHYGTRHRSMMRYCAKTPGSVGFVVSQDGDVRAMTQVHGSVAVWENIKLQLPDFVRRPGIKK